MLFLEQWRSYAFIADPTPLQNESPEWNSFTQEMFRAYTDPPCPPLCSYSASQIASWSVSVSQLQGVAQCTGGSKSVAILKTALFV